MFHLPSLYSECILARWKVLQMHICKGERDRKDKRHQVYKSTNWKGVLRNRRVRCISGAIITEKSSNPILKTYEMHLCMHVHVYSCIWKPANAWCMCGSWRQMHEGTFSFHHVGSGGEIQLLVWWQAPLPTEPSCGLGIPIFNAVTMFKNYRIRGG